MAPLLSSRRWLSVASGVVVVIGLGLWLFRPWAVLLPLPPPPSLPFQVVFHGPRDAQTEAALVAALESARAHWKDFTGEELQLNPHRPLHFVTRFEALPRHRERETHPTWEKFEACEGAVHFAPYHFSSEKPMSRRVDYDELQELLERELLRKGLIVLRGHEPQPWLLDGAISALRGEHTPKKSLGPSHQERLAIHWLHRRKAMDNRLAWLCGESIHSGSTRCSASQSSPWILPLLRYLQEIRGPRAVVETLRTAEDPVDLVSALAPELSEKELRAFDDNFETYLQRSWAELIPPAPDGTSPSEP